MKYDDASWHYGGEFPEDSPDEYGATHIALFLRWCFAQGWAGALHLEAEPEKVKEVIDGQRSATEFFLALCDGKLVDENLNEEGNAFAAQYYGKEGLYLDDYAEHFGDLLYVEPEGSHDYEKFSEMMRKRFESGVLTVSQAKAAKPRWKFW